MTLRPTPRRYQVADHRTETGDTATFTLVATGEPVGTVRPGQFMVLTADGVGEAPISLSGAPGRDGAELMHTVRADGPVTAALSKLRPGQVVEVRGPYGRPWPVGDSTGRDLVFVAGGIGLAALRPAVLEGLASPRHKRIVVLVGARTPDDLLYSDDLAEWSRRPDLALALTVDQAWAGWRGNVGVVTSLLRRAVFDPTSATAFVCGPEVMMRIVADSLLSRGVAASDIWLYLERNRRCAAGLCGHDRPGSLPCSDGPVVDLDTAQALMATKWSNEGE